MQKNKLFVIMGVSGTGKTTIGTLLSEELGVPFFDGDDFHPECNITKMSAGQALTDEDRYDWLLALHHLLNTKKESGAIVACSALKEVYRDILKKDLKEELRFIYLQGSYEEVKSRMELRKGHFMPLDLLKTQFQTLEEPKECIKVSIAGPPKEIVQNILKHI